MDERKRDAMDAMLEHSAKGTKWKDHKYVGVVTTKNGNKRYIYKSTKSPNTTVKVNDKWNAFDGHNPYKRIEFDQKALYGKQNKNERRSLKNVKRDYNSGIDDDQHRAPLSGKRADQDKRMLSSLLSADQRKASYKAKIKYHATVNKVKKYVKKGKELINRKINFKLNKDWYRKNMIQDMQKSRVYRRQGEALISAKLHRSTDKNRK